MSGTDATVAETLLGLLGDHLRNVPADVDWATACLPDLGLDSLAAIELVIHIEDTFGTEFPPELLVRETFATLGSLERAVTCVVSASAGRRAVG